MGQRHVAANREKAPGWVKRVLTKRPQIQRIIGEPIERMYDCGVFGCVFQSNDPWSVKLTIDPDEGDMWAALLADRGALRHRWDGACTRGRATEA